MIAENVDDLLIRLDEFEHLLEMVETDSQTCFNQHLPVLKKKYSDLQITFEKIDRLEVMVARIKSDMDKVERQLIEAESTVPADQTLQPLRAFIKPAFIFVSSALSASKGTTKISPDEKVQKLKIVVLTTRRRCRAYRTWLCSLYRIIRLGWF